MLHGRAGRARTMFGALLHRALLHRALVFGAGSLAVVAPRVAFAQEEPAPPVIVPPQLLTPVVPSYPEGAEGGASVVLAVTVEASGNVGDVRVLEGIEPFGAAAIASVQQARFVPASRDGKPIAVTVRFRVEFTKPAAPEPPPLEPPVATIAPPPRKEEVTENVVIRGGRAAASGGVADTLGRAEVRQLPGAFGDPFRAVEVAPGMTPVITGLPYFYVRGAPPGNVGYFYDGVRVPYLFHFGLGPAVIHPGLIQRTDLHKGGYPAALGRYAGGIVDATATAPGTVFHGEGQLRLIDAGALVEAPFANGRGSALAAGRWSYTATLFSLLQSDTSLDYRDYQARVSYALGDRDTISLLAFGAYDLASQRDTVDSNTFGAGLSTRVDDTPREVDRILFASEFHRADVRWDHLLGHGGKLRAAATIGFDRTRVEARRAAQDIMTGGRLDFVQPLSRAVTLRAGADVVIDRYEADALPKFSDDDDVVKRQQNVFVDRVDFATGARVDAILTPFPELEVVPGVRLDVYGSAGVHAVTVDPRLTARFAVSDRVRIVHAYGVASQTPSTPVALPAITVARLSGGMQRAYQTSAGVEVDLPKDLTASAAVFHNVFSNLNDALGTAQVEIVDLERSDALLGKSRGSAYGLELGLRRKFTNRVSGIVSYTLSRSERTADGRNFISAYDRPHVFSAALSFDLGRGYRAGGRFVAYSGIPLTAMTPAFPEQVVGQPPERTPAFVRLDVRFEKRWAIGTRGGYISLVLEALNATLSREVTGYRCGTGLALPGFTPQEPFCVQRVVGPVSVPSFGVEGGF